MNLESVRNVILIISTLVPGFVYSAVLTKFVPLRQNREKEILLLRFLTITAVNYAIFSPLILITGAWLSDRPLYQVIAWFFIIIVAPACLAILSAEIIQHNGFAWVYRWLHLYAISPIPTGWDWIFSRLGRTGPCFILITLTDGTEIAGYFGPNSMASSDPERKDIYLEKVYTVPPDGGEWKEVEGSLGMHVNGAQIAYIEFRSSE